MFFINILPSNDWQNDGDVRASIKSAADESVALGFKHTLVTVGHKRLDPWTAAQFGMQTNAAFSPLIAVNPAYQHPVLVAKRLQSLQALYENHLAVNLVSGSFAGEMKSIGDTLDLAARNARLQESLLMIEGLLGPRGRVDKHEGHFYHAAQLDVFPKSRAERPIDFYLSGSFSERMAEGGRRHFIKNIRPLTTMEKAPNPHCGLGLGLCVRATDEEAMSEIEKLFPVSRKGEMLHAMSMANSETPWNQWLKPYLEKNSPRDPMYYLEPMRGFLSSAPYLVGSYQTAAKRIKEYAALGYGFFLVDYALGDGAHVARCLELLR